MNLFQVVASVNQVKLAPLPGSERSEEGMVENFSARSKLPGTRCDRFIHGSEG